MSYPGKPLCVITVARKPLSRDTVAANLLVHGAGAVNIDATRISIQSGSGRWPANLILEHLKGCRCIGVKHIRPHNGSGRAGPGGHGFQSEYVGGVGRSSGFSGGYVKENGTELVSAWECQWGCPIQAIDIQSGPPEDAGVSRFFKAVGGIKSDE